MGNRTRDALVVLATWVTVVFVFEGCGGRSEDERRSRGDGSEGAQAGEGGEPSGAGGTGASGAGGIGARGGGMSGMSGDEGGGGESDEGGSAGAGATAGNAGSGGAPVECPTDGSDCPDGCFELPVRTGCEPDLVRSHVCTAGRYDTTRIGCGVRESDGAVFYVDAPYDSTSGLNPFYEIEGFRACTQSEVDASDCRDFTDVPASRTVRMDAHA